MMNNTAVLSFIAITASAMLLLTPKSIRDDESTDIVRTMQSLAIVEMPRTAYLIKREQFVSADPELKDSPSTAPVISHTGASAPTSGTRQIDWTEVMYPELARLEELESEPVITALGELWPMLSSDDPVIRLAALEALGDMTLKEALPGLVAALSDPNSQLRVAALEAISIHNDVSVASAIESVLFDPEPEVRVAAIETLADLESEVSVHALASLLSDPNAAVRHQAVFALGEIGGKDAMMYLLQARYDPVATIRKNADAILAELEFEAAY